MNQTLERSELKLADETATDALGGCLADAVRADAEEIRARGLNIRLEGTLGAGKTTLTRAALRALGVTGRVKSPTFTLVETYSPSGLTVNHFDFYRFEDPAEFDEAGFRELFGPGQITVCEWSEKAAPYLPDDDLTVSLQLDGDGRRALLLPRTDIGNKVVQKVLSEWK